jgi:hypothetical protein
MKRRVKVQGLAPAQTGAILQALQSCGYSMDDGDDASACVVIAPRGSSHLLLRLGRRRVVLEAGASVEEIVFWVNELWFERRRPGGPRCPLELPVVLAHGTRVFRTRTTNLAEAGLFALIATPPARGEAVGVELHLDDGLPPLRALGMVVKSVRGEDDALVDDTGTVICAHPGVAIELVGLSAAGKRRLRQRIQQALRELRRPADGAISA